MARNSYKKMTEKDMFAMAKLSINEGKSHTAIATITGFPRRSVSNFLGRASKKHKDFWLVWDSYEGNVNIKSDTPRILIYDIETAPMLAYAWGLFKQNIGINMIKEDWFVMTWAAKWFGEEEILSDSCWNYAYDPENKEHCDFHVIESLWALFEEADMIVAHNGNRFDIKKVTARAITMGFRPHSNVKKIDTMLIAKNAAAFSSNKLDWLARTLCGEQKIDTGGFELWANCLAGCEESWKKMLDYNKQDVTILENVFVALSPYDDRAPSFVTHTDATVTTCINPTCGSTNVREVGTHKTNVSEFVAYQCADCGKNMRGRRNIRSKEQMEVTLTNRL